MRITLLRFFRTFQKYLANAFSVLIISLLRFYKKTGKNIEKTQ
jgi:hypothetical protein